MQAVAIFICIEAWVSISYKWFLTWRLNESSVYSNPGIISYCSPDQARMAGASTSVYKFDNVAIGQHIYKSDWTLFTDKAHKYILREDNKRDK